MHNEEEQLYNKPFSWKVWAKMFPFFLPYKRKLGGIMILMLILAAVDMFIPLLQKYVIDTFIVPKTADGIIPVTVAAGAVFIITTVFTIIFIRIAIQVEVLFARDLRKKLFDHLQTLSISYYNTTPVGYMIARVMSDTNRIGELVAWGLVDVMWGLAYVVFVIIAMMVLEWRLGIIIVVMIPVMALITTWFQQRILRYNREVRQLNSRITGSYNEGINGARTSKTLVIEEINSREFSLLSGKFYRSAVNATTLSSIYMPIMMFFGVIAVALILVNGSGMVVEGMLQFGTMSAMISYAIGIFEPIQHLTRTFANVVATQANIERVSSLLETKPLITESPEVIEKYGDSFDAKPENWEPLHGDIKFDDITFMYPDGNENVLEHFNLDVPAGTTVAIVGETGAGKSTLVNLVCRFFEPTKGKVLIDGRDYRERSQLWLHSNIGYVLQSPHLFSGNVRENIRYGRLGASDEDIMRAAKLVCADKVIEKLEQGLDTDVGEGGDRLSTGEKQLISFARAVLADPRIFVLDEATSSIDTQTEALIQNAISNILEGRTSFLIAHRLSTIKMADLILVVRDGKIIERGTHRDLLAKGGYYRQLYTMQFETESKKNI
ncbi:MAG: ABC transporter ATP-binding protein/permease [Oscillospiraceae bacterium]|nr:ABC transporter ATP-binding protein/permease [Oscillospiraceae bacterium]